MKDADPEIAGQHNESTKLIASMTERMNITLRVVNLHNQVTRKLTTRNNTKK